MLALLDLHALIHAAGTVCARVLCRVRGKGASLEQQITAGVRGRRGKARWLCAGPLGAHSCAWLQALVHRSPTGRSSTRTDLLMVLRVRWLVMLGVLRLVVLGQN